MPDPDVRVEFHFDFGSPNAYLAHLVIPEIERAAGVPFAYVPVLLGGVFKATGNVSPAISLRGVKNKPAYRALEMRRFLAKHGIRRFAPNPFFPVLDMPRFLGLHDRDRDDARRRFGLPGSARRREEHLHHLALLDLTPAT